MSSPSYQSKRQRRKKMTRITRGLLCGSVLAMFSLTTTAQASNRDPRPRRNLLTFDREMPESALPAGAWKPHIVCGESNECMSSWTETVGNKVGTLTVSFPFARMCESGALLSWEQWSTGDTLSKVEIGFARSGDTEPQSTGELVMLPLMSRGCVMGCPSRETWKQEESEERTSVSYDLHQVLTAMGETDRDSVDCSADTVVLRFTAKADNDPTAAFRLDNISIRFAGTTWGPETPEYYRSTLDQRYQDPRYGNAWNYNRYPPSGYGYPYSYNNWGGQHQGRTQINISPPSPREVRKSLKEFMRDLPRPPGAPKLFGGDKHTEKKEKKK